MLSLISFLIVIAGSINWFCISIMQYDYIAGLFGSQANLFSRVVYFLIGMAALWMLFAWLRGKGTIKINGRRSADKEILSIFKRKQKTAPGAEQPAQPQMQSAQPVQATQPMPTAVPVQQTVQPQTVPVQQPAQVLVQQPAQPSAPQPAEQG